jgi:hypothetical protein
MGHSKNVLSFIETMLQGALNTTSQSWRLSQKHMPSSVSLQSASNITPRRDQMGEKHFVPIILTDDGIMIDSILHPEKASAPMSVMLESASNVTLESFWHSEKQRSPIVFTHEGITIVKKESKLRRLIKALKKCCS